MNNKVSINCMRSVSMPSHSEAIMNTATTNQSLHSNFRGYCAGECVKCFLNVTGSSITSVCSSKWLSVPQRRKHQQNINRILYNSIT
jgi:hypothetical protein